MWMADPDLSPFAAAIGLIVNLWTFGSILLIVAAAARKLWRGRPRWLGRNSARRLALKQLALLRATAREPRALILALGQRAGFIIFLIGLALLNDTFLAADRTRALRDGKVSHDLLTSMLAVHLMQLLLATGIMLVAIDTVDQLRLWAAPAERRRAIMTRYCRTYRTSKSPA